MGFRKQPNQCSCKKQFEKVEKLIGELSRRMDVGFDELNATVDLAREPISELDGKIKTSQSSERFSLIERRLVELSDAVKMLSEIVSKIDEKDTLRSRHERHRSMYDNMRYN